MASANMVTRNRLRVRAAAAGDAADMARIHEICFPEGFLTRVGLRGLEMYYRFFIESPLGSCFVLERGAEVVGFVSGWRSGSGYRRPLMRSIGVPLGARLLAALLRSPWTMVPMLWERRGFLAAGMLPGLARAEPAPAELGNAVLLSIAVLPRELGRGGARLLEEAFVEECRRCAVPRIHLSVRRENLRAQAFYDKLGWRRFDQSEHLIHYRRPLV